MKTIINNNERVFLIHREGYFNRDFFCNLSQIPDILTNELEKNDSYTISEYWNKKFKKCSKRHLNEMFQANQITFKIK